MSNLSTRNLSTNSVDFAASEVKGPADVVIVGPTTAGEDNDVELNEDEDLQKIMHSQLKQRVKETYFLKKKRKKLKFNHLKRRARKMKQIWNGKSLALLHFRTAL